MNLCLFVPDSTSPRFINSQLVSLPLVGIFNKLLFNLQLFYKWLFMSNKIKVFFNKKRETYSSRIHNEKSLNASKLNQKSRMARWKSLFNSILRHNHLWKFIPCFIEIKTDKRKRKKTISIRRSKILKSLLGMRIGLTTLRFLNSD